MKIIRISKIPLMFIFHGKITNNNFRFKCFFHFNTFYICEKLHCIVIQTISILKHLFEKQNNNHIGSPSGSVE